MMTYKSEDWRRRVLSTIGGSSAASAVGKGYQTPRQLWARMRAARAGDPLPDIETDDMRRGTLLEGVALKLLAEMGQHVDRWDQTNFIQHPDWPWAHALPDAVVTPGGVASCVWLVEAKVPRPATFARIARTGNVPENWRIQCQHNMAITGYRLCILALLDPVACHLDTYTITADEGYQAWLMEAESAYWRHVLQGTLPDDSQTVPDLPACTEKAALTVVECESPNARRLAKTLLRLRELSEELDEEQAALRAALVAEACGAPYFEVPGLDYVDGLGRTWAGIKVYNRASAPRKSFDADVARMDLQRLHAVAGETYREDKYLKTGAQPKPSFLVYPLHKGNS